MGEDSAISGEDDKLLTIGNYNNPKVTQKPCKSLHLNWFSHKVHTMNTENEQLLFNYVYTQNKNNFYKLKT